MVKAKAFIFEKQFVGFPKETDLKLVEEELPAIKDGEFLAEAVYLSVDPYMRAYAPRLPLGNTFIGSQVAIIKESKNQQFPVGKYVLAEFGWRTHTISNGEKLPGSYSPITLLPDFEDLPLSYALGILGMPGHTAYFGFLELLEPKAGDRVIVSGAAGAVGSIVGQLAKLKGCTVVGIAGSDEKGRWLTEELGFDHFINYKTADLDRTLKELAPEGFDLYFDNVGGDISSTVLNHMKLYGKIALCGCISGYNEISQKVDPVQRPMITYQLRMEGFLVWRWVNRWPESFAQNKTWIKEGKLKYRETITEGFENMFKAFTDMLKGGNTGKAAVKV